MKKFLLATTVLAMSATVAAAEVTVGGDGRMGVTYTEGAANELAFTSRIRISFTASGETDGGLSFGGSIRADNAGGGAAGTAGSVFVSGAFGKLTMGDVGGAAEFAVPHVDGVGLTGLGDMNENLYLSNKRRSAARYEYSAGAISFAISADNPGLDGAGVSYNLGNVVTGLLPTQNTYAVGVKYSTDAYTVGLGYETTDIAGTSVDHVIIGGSATFSGITFKLAHGQADIGAATYKQTAVSASYSMDGLGLTAYYRQNGVDVFGGDMKAYGVGASYDLGGGAKVVGGIANSKVGAGASTTVADVGLSFSF
ncbi:porin [Thioclava sp. FR2]|uniref:porin n=1 Tax=Thioclava sp. FR2 TaxID=3445780 RepID=UPI003EB8D602